MLHVTYNGKPQLSLLQVYRGAKVQRPNEGKALPWKQHIG